MKPYLLFTILYFYLFALSAQAPSIQWQKCYGGTNLDEPCTIVEVSNGYIIAGNSQSVDGDIANPLGGAGDMWIYKIDSVGNIIWNKNIGGSGTDQIKDIIKMDDGNIMIAGFTYSNDGNVTSNHGNADVWLIKIDLSGNVLWEKTYGGTGKDMGYGIVQTADGFVVTGFTDSNNGDVSGNHGTGANNFDTWTFKIDTSGTLLWQKCLGGSHADQSFSICKTTDGNFIIAGASSSNDGDVSGHHGTPGLTKDYWIAKLDAIGNIIWQKSPGGTNTESASKVLPTSNGGGIIIGSVTTSNASIPGALGSYSTGVIQLSTTGSTDWAKCYGGYGWEKGLNMYKAINGDYIMNGSTTSFDHDVSGIHGDTNDVVNLKSDAWVVRIDSTGNIKWQKCLGGTNSDVATYSIVCSDGSILMAGTSMSIDGDVSGFHGGTFHDCWLVKLDTIQVVWPGDANHDYIVTNNDLLPVGLYYSNTGPARSSLSNAWQGIASINWGISQNNGADIKHADCNGDGLINSDDTLAINLNFTSIHGFTQSNYIESNRDQPPLLAIIPSSTLYNSADWVEAEIWLGNSQTPVNNLYGISFNIHYDASLIQPGTESLTFPSSSWLGDLGTDVIKIGKVSPLVNTVFGAITRIDRTNRNGYGKIADFKFQIKNASLPPTSMLLSISCELALDSAGSLQLFTPRNDSILINHSTTNAKECFNSDKINIYPNPFNTESFVVFDKEQKNTTLNIVDPLGNTIRTMVFSGRQLIIEKGNIKPGIYFIRCHTNNGFLFNKKIIIY